MRLRNKPWAMDMLKEYPQYVIANPKEQAGKWNEEFNNNKPIHIEIGTGRGNFIIGMAKANPHVNFIGIEKYTSVIVDVLEKVIEDELSNVKLLNDDANALTSFFTDNEISRIYLNFSDPWPKNRHEKRRLTYKDFLAKYRQVMVPEGEVHMKTDNQSLFEYSLSSFSQFGMVLSDVSLDFHKSDMSGNVMTEYEEKFSKQGKRIYRCETDFRLLNEYKKK